MATVLSGDKEFENIPSIQAKALRINLNENIYGTFAEIGAGQEVARHFFRSGGASGTIAKTMSAYDKEFSDAIYGIEDDKRYVTEARCKKMLSHEMRLIEERIPREKHPNKLFFSYANTVATIDFAKKYKGHGWMGVRFQVAPDEAYNEIILHFRFHQNEARLQQETLGIMGVNLIYGAYYKFEHPKKLLRYLYDHIDKDTIEIDTINFSGPRFDNVDNRLMSLQLVKNGMTEAVMFGPDGNNILPARILYKKNILALRGSFRPVTKVNMDMYKKSYEIFIRENKVQQEKTVVIFEITLSNLKAARHQLVHCRHLRQLVHTRLKRSGLQSLVPVVKISRQPALRLRLLGCQLRLSSFVADLGNRFRGLGALPHVLIQVAHGGPLYVASGG